MKPYVAAVTHLMADTAASSCELAARSRHTGELEAADHPTMHTWQGRAKYRQIKGSSGKESTNPRKVSCRQVRGGARYYATADTGGRASDAGDYGMPKSRS
jgi:hypothetical protein